MNLARVAFPSTLVLCGVLVLVLPIARHLRATGTTGVVFRKEADPFQRLMGVAMGVLVTGVTVWCGVLVPLLGTAAVGVWSAPPALGAFGGALVAAGVLVIAVAQAAMGRDWRVGIDSEPTALVLRGPFRVVRNPIYSGLLLAMIGGTLASPSPWTLMGCGTAWLLIQLQTRLEEHHLLLVHGASYREYASKVGRFLPFVGRLSPRG